MIFVHYRKSRLLGVISQLHMFPSPTKNDLKNNFYTFLIFDHYRTEI